MGTISYCEPKTMPCVDTPAVLRICVFSALSVALLLLQYPLGRLHLSLAWDGAALLLSSSTASSNRNAAAAEVLTSLDKGKSTAASKVLLAIALARQGKMDLGREVTKTASAAENTDPGMAYLMARLYALTGSSAGAIASLARCLESLPPSGQDGVKNHARQCPDFASVFGSAEFEQALSVESKVAESRCTGGSGCANCPMRGGCPRSHAQQSR